MLLAEASSRDAPSTLGILILISAGLGVALLAMRLGDRSARRKLAAAGIEPAPKTRGRPRAPRWGPGTPEEIARRRSVRGYARLLRRQPGFVLRALSVAALVGAGAGSGELDERLVAVGITLGVGFPATYLYWRWHGWRSVAWWERPGLREVAREGRDLPDPVNGG
jgi:hypothetical protein